MAVLFASAAYRLGARGVDTVRGGLGPWEWVALVLVTSLFVWGEGVRALDRRYAPWLVGRVDRLRRDSSRLWSALAPLYAMALVGGPRRSVARAWAGTAAIVAAVLVVRALPEPWRGITDFAVAAALAWGLVAILREAAMRLR